MSNWSQQRNAIRACNTPMLAVLLLLFLPVLAFSSEMAFSSKLPAGSAPTSNFLDPGLSELQRRLSLAVLAPVGSAADNKALALDLRHQGLELWANAPDQLKRSEILNTLQQWGLLADFPGWNPRVTLPQFAHPSLPLAPDPNQIATRVDFNQPAQPLVVHFWAQWCGPCREELPQLASYYAEHYLALQSAGIALVTVNNDPTFNTASGQAVVAGIGQLPVLHDPDFQLYRRLAQSHEVALPATFLVQPDAPIRVLAYGPMQWLAPDLTQNLQALVYQREREAKLAAQQ